MSTALEFIASEEARLAKEQSYALKRIETTKELLLEFPDLKTVPLRRSPEIKYLFDTHQEGLDYKFYFGKSCGCCIDADDVLYVYVKSKAGHTVYYLASNGVSARNVRTSTVIPESIRAQVVEEYDKMLAERSSDGDGDDDVFV